MTRNLFACALLSLLIAGTANAATPDTTVFKCTIGKGDIASIIWNPREKEYQFSLDAKGNTESISQMPSKGTPKRYSVMGQNVMAYQFEYEGQTVQVLSEYDPRSGKDYSTVSFGETPDTANCTKRLDGGQRAIDAKLRKQKIKLPFAK